MFVKQKYNFWKQKNINPFVYNYNYKKNQSTNIAMSFLRLGFLSSCFTYEQMKSMTAVDIGCGNNVFVNSSKSFFKKIYGFDVSGISITNKKLLKTKWDLIVLTDVLEHYENIDELFKLTWRYALISFPETPVVKRWEHLKKWRHFKPDEHIWCLNLIGIKKWFNDNNCTILRSSNLEDFIRQRWDNNTPNITTIIVERR